ncbi:MAG: glycosyltransferase [Myxococcota bacterium]
MKILHLTSDWKWTGPADPMLVSMQAMRQRGHRVELACAAPPAGAGRNLLEEAARRGLPPIATLPRGRGAWQRGDGAVVRTLAAWLAGDAVGGPFDVVHVWHARDHALALRARARHRRLDRGRGRVQRRAGAGARDAARSEGGEAAGGEALRIVRFLASAEPVAGWPWNRWLLGEAGCDGLLCVSAGASAALRRLRPAGALAVTPGAVDLDALDRAAGRDPARDALPVADEAFLIGVVARLQPHRRFDLLFAALAELVRARPEVRLVLFGRGTRAEAVVGEPVRRLGLERFVVRAGYRTEDYARLLAAMDVVTFLVPGSDGTCRALREAAALGRPLVGTRRGAIPEIVVDGETGLLVDETPASLAAAWASLAADPARRQAMGEAARRDARVRFAPEALGAFTERFYEAIVARSAPTSSR